MIAREVLTARRAKVAELTRAGHSASDIAFILGISQRAVQRDRQAAGLTAGWTPPLPMSEQARARAAQMLADGASYAEAARTIGVSATTIARHLPGFSWSKSDCARHSNHVQALNRLQAVLA